MAPGPMELFLLAFPGTQSQPRVVAALDRAQTLSDVRVVDALIVTKSSDGAVDAAELSDVDELADLAASLGLDRSRGTRGERDLDGASALDAEAPAGIDAEDAEEIGAAMEQDSTALALLIEHGWARELTDAVREVDGGSSGMVAAVRIPREGLAEGDLVSDDDLLDLDFTVETAVPVSAGDSYHSPYDRERR